MRCERWFMPAGNQTADKHAFVAGAVPVGERGMAAAETILIAVAA
jgi:hypothetical protein